ncbi:MAG: hypothetical protein HC922_11155, partial [Leptolyngbyaceae cyanobacterium SM2_3_12]|nr:hypothetical protein [Leptolyngbyaceae cyanobacterium SM2_3_12]
MTSTFSIPSANLPRPRLAISLGDPAGIGPEVVLKALGANGLATLAEVTLVRLPRHCCTK